MGGLHRRHRLELVGRLGGGGWRGGYGGGGGGGGVGLGGGAGSGRGGGGTADTDRIPRGGGGSSEKEGDGEGWRWVGWGVERRWFPRRHRTDTDRVLGFECRQPVLSDNSG